MDHIDESMNLPKVRIERCGISPTKRETSAATKSRLPILRRILLMTDFSPKGRAAYTYAGELAEEHGAEITLTHFGRDGPQKYSGVSKRDHRRAQFENLNNERRSPELANARTSSRLLVHRNVAKAVRNFGDAGGYDLVVIYSPSTTRFDRFSSIDYAGDLLIGASVPVFLVGPSVQPPGHGNTGVVLFPFDLRRNTGAPFHSIDWVSRHFKGSFHFSQVTRSTSIENPSWFEFPTQWRKPRALRRAAVLSETVERISTNPTNALQIKMQIDAPTILGSVTEYARELNTKLIVVGNERGLRNRVLNLVREAPCPVLAVPNLIC